MFKRFFSKNQTRQSFDKNALTLRLLADVRVVDPDQDRLGSHNSEPVPVVNLVAKPFVPDVAAQLCLDFGNYLQWLSDEDVADWGLTSAELFETAEYNLNQKSQAAQLWRSQSDEGEFFSLVLEGVSQSTLILADGVWNRIGFSKSEIAIVIPDRDSLYFCEKGSESGVEKLRSIAEIVWNNPETIKKYRITKSVLVADENSIGGWSVANQLN